ncbi:MAG: AzlD domain-containing protein [Eubacteriales bacterium]|nr:AzlD domain-containing protein [Eubacteriales bacterium]
MSDGYLLAAIATMAAVTYIPRALPLILVRGKIESHFVRSFLYYVPYAVLASMTVPAIFGATDSPWSAGAGFLIAIVLGLRGKSLLTVAIGATAAVWLVEQALRVLLVFI